MSEDFSINSAIIVKSRREIGKRAPGAESRGRPAAAPAGAAARKNMPSNAFQLSARLRDTAPFVVARRPSALGLIFHVPRLIERRTDLLSPRTRTSGRRINGRPLADGPRKRILVANGEIIRS
ncbi:hypothetical protein EVAR_44372_1 [Eumeta japonica]|uniref:Uncharacterized protein n=1 Tax=Eumeta variegata TaxID=151549 RepID=A0A4C1X8B5_EUMVA|nr:hypothetical protein EVAR_44372_1 [Eumeta japonica]